MYSLVILSYTEGWGPQTRTSETTSGGPSSLPDAANYLPYWKVGLLIPRMRRVWERKPDQQQFRRKQELHLNEGFTGQKIGGKI